MMFYLGNVSFEGHFYIDDEAILKNLFL